VSKNIDFYIHIKYYLGIKKQVVGQI